MSKREVQLYEVLDANKVTVAYAHTIIQARRLKGMAKAGATWQLTNVPLRPDHLAAFLNERIVMPATP